MIQLCVTLLYTYSKGWIHYGHIKHCRFHVTDISYTSYILYLYITLPRLFCNKQFELSSVFISEKMFYHYKKIIQVYLLISL